MPFASFFGMLLWLALLASLSTADMEKFLRTAEIVSIRPVAGSTTHSMRATLSDGHLTHDAHVQTVDVYKAKYTTGQGTEYNFRDSYRYNLAAYKLDRLLGLNMIPPSVERVVNGRPAAVTWWVDDLWGSEKDRIAKNVTPPDIERWNEQNYIVRVFDQLIANVDRNRGNLLIGSDWKI